MHDILKKLWSSKGTVSIVIWVTVFAWAYNLDWVKKPILKQETHRRTIEEIIATPVDKTPAEPWDTEFKSTVEVIK